MCISQPFDFCQTRQRDIHRIQTLLPRQRFFSAIPYRTVHFLSSICSECIPWWSPDRCLLIVHRLRQGYVGSPPPVVAVSFSQCSGSVTFWYGFGSADTYLWLTDPDPAIFVSDLQDATKKMLFYFFAYVFLKVHLHDFLKIKRHKEVTKQ